MLIRFCASVLIALAGLTFGFYRCENLKSELSVSQQTEEFFRSSAIMIRYRCLDVYELIRNARTSGKYPSLCKYSCVLASIYIKPFFHVYFHLHVIKKVV